MIAPVPIWIGDVAGVRFVFGGFTWAFLVSRHRPTSVAALNTIMQPNSRPPMIVGDLQKGPFFQEMMARRQRAPMIGS